MSVQYYIHRARKERQNMRSFDGDVASPVDLGNVAASGASSAYTMRANARLVISHSASLSASDVTVDIGARRSFSHPALSADEEFKGYYAEENQDIVINRGSGAAAGNFSLGVVDPFGRTRIVATATFT